MKESHSTYASAGLGGSVAVVLVWLCSVCHLQMPDYVAIAWASLLSAAFGRFLHAYVQSRGTQAVNPPDNSTEKT